MLDVKRDFMRFHIIFAVLFLLPCGMSQALALLPTATFFEDSEHLRQNVTVQGIRTHQKALQDIADSNNGSRVAGSSGYRDSVAYVKAQVEEAGYDVNIQDFPLVLAEDAFAPELSVMMPVQQSFEALRDFASMNMKGGGEANAEIEAVDLLIPSPEPNSSTSGCEPEDFSSFKPGNIALIQRGSCPFITKINNAILAQASAVIIFNEGNADRTDFISTRLEFSPNIPVLGASFATGDSLRSGLLRGRTGIEAFIKVSIINNIRNVQNIIAESQEGDNSRVVVVGAHLDSVRSGPGINDNGSGSASVLEIALKYKELGMTPRNKLRFIWFGAEEFGLVGSEHYVNSLSDEQKDNILAMLNFDMLGSSNYARFVYDGDSSPLNPQGSAYIERIFLDYFSHLGMESSPTAFNGRSDYGPFIQSGIPAGGLFSGAEGIKSRYLAEIYGGRAGAPFDPCYHRRCDNYQNTGETPSSSLALTSLNELSHAAAHAVLILSKTEDQIRLPQAVVSGLPKPEFEYRGDNPIK